MKIKNLFAALALAASVAPAAAQTDVSLFVRADKVQRAVLDTTANDMFRTIGHHGPAIENSYMALRVYYKDGCAIDVYTKTKSCLELEKYGWYPKPEDMAAGSGSDEYLVGKTPGLGGFSLWDGEKVVPLTSTEGRRIEVAKEGKGSKLSMLLRGVEYKGGKVDIKLTVSVEDGSRDAIVEAECVSGQKVVFVSGVNFHKGQQIQTSCGHVAVWGLHPANVVKNPSPLGGGLAYCSRAWKGLDIDTELGYVGIMTKKAVKKASVRVCSASAREDALNTQQKFFDYVSKM